MNGLVDLGRAIKAPFADRDWPMKTLLGFVFSILVFTIPAVYGAQLEYIRRVARGNEELPGWDDFGNKWVEGFMILVAGFIYFLPVFVLAVVFFAPVLVAAAPGASNDAIPAVVGGVCAFMIFAVVYSIAVSIFFYAAQVNYAMKGGFGAFFEIAEIIGRVRNGDGFFVAWLYIVIISFGFSALSSIISTATAGLGGILTAALTYLFLVMTAHLLGQWAARSYRPVAAPSAWPPPAPGGYASPPPGPYVPPAPPAPPAPGATPSTEPSEPPPPPVAR